MSVSKHRNIMAKNTKTPIYPIYDNGDLHVFVSKGNGKLGNIPGINLLPGNKPLTNSKGVPYTNISGTCGKHCALCLKACYAVRYMKYHHNSTVKGYATNTYMMRNEPEKFLAQIKEYCDKNIVKYFRYHTSGEIESVEQLELYARICREIPDVIFYIYTKSFDILTEWLNKGNDIPENFVINLSEWHGNLKEYAGSAMLDLCNIFAYDDKDSDQSVKSLPHCPAVDKDGHETGITCAKCRMCMKRGTKIAVYSH